MKRKINQFTGQRPIFTGSPSVVQGGFNLDVATQSFSEGDVIPAGSLAIFNELTRLVSIVRTAKVAAIDADDAKIVSLYVDEFYAPCFVSGMKVLKAGSISGTYAAAPSISSLSKSSDGTYTITLSAAITGLAVGDTLIEVVANSSSNAAEFGTANCVTVSDVRVREFETPIDVSADTMQYALYERRVPPIPDSQKGTGGLYIAGNVHVKLTQSY